MSYRILNQDNYGLIDSCQGDSGGPIWRLIENPETGETQAVIVGVVKAGLGTSIG